MKCQLIVLLLVLVGLFAVSSADGDEETKAFSSNVLAKIRAKFVMPKLFDFNAYRERFHKHYPNAVELARRAKLFMARAFAVFASAIKYMYRKSTKFLKINPHSDWTQAERDAILIYVGKRPASGRISSPSPSIGPKDVGRELDEIAGDPKYATVPVESETSHRRKRRSVSGPTARRELSVDQLTGDDNLKPINVSSKYAVSVPSNNPGYKQVDMLNKRAGDDLDHVESLEPIPSSGAKVINGQSDQGNLDPLFDHTKNETNLLADSNDIESDKMHLEGSPQNEVYLDYRDTGCLLPPKQQGLCGACYIFAPTAQLEYHHCNQTGKLVAFSEQYAVDCGPMYYFAYVPGCKGGPEYNVPTFYNDYGLELSADYPYKGKDGHCPHNSTFSFDKLGHTRIFDVENVSSLSADKLTPKIIEQSLKEIGPLTITIKLGDDFDDYGGGVDTLKCRPEKIVGHAMVIIGHGIEDGLEYWLIRNSYGVKFGLQGNYKLAKQIDDDCLIRVGYVRAKFYTNPHVRGLTVLVEDVADERPEVEAKADLSDVKPSVSEAIC